MPTQIYKNIYKIDIPLPNNPLKALNCYVIMAGNGGKNLLIDTGFNMTECYDALLIGMQELGISPQNTDVFITHVHSDHTGNAAKLFDKGAHIFMSRADFEELNCVNWDERGRFFVSEGMPKAEWAIMLTKNPAISLAPNRFCAEIIDDNTLLSYGGFSLRCVHTPGHSPGHMCLYCEKEKLFFSGDHVLFDITPNICSIGLNCNLLGDYLKSLNMIKSYSIDITLPAHRTIGGQSIYERIDALITHHAERLSEIENIIHKNPGATAYDIAGFIRWKINAQSWSAFPPSQKCFAIGEAIAHLDYLRAAKSVYRELDSGGIYHYFGR